MEQDRLLVIAPTQWPYHVRNTVAAATGLPPDRVVVSLPEMSTHKDSRIWYPSLVAAHCALLTQASGQAVKLVLRREETGLAGPRRAPARIRIRTALDKNGTPIAEEIQLRLDGGAFPLMADELLDRALLGSAGPYRNANVRVAAQVVESSNPPMDCFLGLGLAQGAFASETHASRIAELSQIDPFRWKSENLIKEGESFPTGGTPASYPPHELLDRVAALSDFRRKHAAYEMRKKRRDTIREKNQSLRGIGLSISFQGGGFYGREDLEASFSVIVRLEADGRLLIFTSGVSIDGAARKIWQDSAWRILGIERKSIVCKEMTTDEVPDSGPSAFSRNITIIDVLVERCCQTIARRRFRSGLPIEVKKSYRKPRAHRWSAETLTGLPFPALSWAASVVECEVDPVTFETDIRGIWTAVSCGELLNPAVARKTIENGIFHAILWCSSTHGSLRDPRFETLPPITIEFVTPDTRAPSGGIEELAGSIIPSAYVSAVAQATGRYFDSLPITPELIHRYTEDM
jgi:CO/xanthine dehydrogenase Mo-binding subunit